jgi:plastocyanin
MRMDPESGKLFASSSPQKSRRLAMQFVLGRYVISCAFGILLLLSSCAGPEQVFKAGAPAGQKVRVEMKASSFAFDPDVIEAKRGSTLVLHVTNVSGVGHNITVKDPAGNVLKSQDIAPNESITVEIGLPNSGIYPFYCDKTLHSTFGMKGRIEVS